MDSKFRSHVAAKLDKQQRRQRKVHTIRAVCMSVLLLTYAAGVYLAASSWQPQLQAFSPELIASRWPFKPYTGRKLPPFTSLVAYLYDCHNKQMRFPSR